MAKILVIDDERLVREAVRQVLASDRHEVKTASDGKEGMTLLEQFRPDLVITDILMPEKAGVDVIAEIRQGHQETKIIAMSGGGRVGNTDYLKVAEKLGADQVLMKPFRNDELLKLVKQVLATPRPAVKDMPGAVSRRA